MHQFPRLCLVLFCTTVIGAGCGAKVEVSSETSATEGAAGAGGQAGTSTGTGGTGGEAEHLQHVWSKAFGNDAYQRLYGIDVAPNSDIVLCGDFNGTTDFGGGILSTDYKTALFLARLDGTGSHVWSAAFADIGFESQCDVATDSMGNIIVGGMFQGVLNMGGPPLIGAGSNDNFLAKLGPAGEHLWSKQFSNGDWLWAPSITVDPTGAVILAGGFDGTVNFGGTDLVSDDGGDIYVAKLDPAGSHLWSIRAGGSGNQVVRDVAVDQAGNIYVAGNFGGMLDFGAPSTDPLDAGAIEDAFLVKLNANGEYVWGKQFGNSAEQWRDSATRSVSVVSAAPSGAVAIAGAFNGTIDFGGGPVSSPSSSNFFVAAYDPAGSHVWSTAHGEDPSLNFVVSIDHAASGGIALAGSLNGTLDFGGASLADQGNGDVFLGLLDGQGAPVSMKSYGGPSIDYPCGIVVDNDGSVILAATAQGPAGFGGAQFPYAADGMWANAMDVVVAKYKP